MSRGVPNLYNCYLADKMRYSVKAATATEVSERPPTHVGAAIRDTPADAFRDGRRLYDEADLDVIRRNVVPGQPASRRRRRLLRRMSKQARFRKRRLPTSEHPDVQKLSTRRSRMTRARS